MNLLSTDTLSLLRRGPFARYIAGETISMLGTWMQQMAQGWVMASLTTSAFALGMANFAVGIPILLLSMHAGLLADRADKRFIVFAALGAQSVLAMTLGWLVGSGQIAVWHVVAAGVVLGITTAFEMPAAAALVPELVPRDRMHAAIAIDRAVFHATRLAGPALGGWMIGAMGAASAFYVNAVSYGALMIALLTLSPRPRGTDAEEELRQTGLREGFTYARGDEPTRRMLMLMSMSTLFVSPFFVVMLPLYAQHTLSLGAREYGLLMAASGFGAFAGSIHLLSIAKTRRFAWLLGAVGCIFVAMVCLCLARSLAVALLGMVALTMGTSTLFGLAQTIVQERAPDPLRGRVSAIVGLSFFGVIPFSGLAMSAIVDAIGVRTALAASALCFGIGALALCLRQRAMRPINSDF